MNPFKWLPIYGDDVINRYNGRPYGSLPPHCFQEAEDAFVQLQKTRKNQAIVICGESGAGKTETTKLMLYYLAIVSRRATERSQRRASADGGSTSRRSSEGGGFSSTGSSGSSGKQPTIAERMVNSNPLLEAFGNAKTLRNNNSSRFGKFTRYDFARDSPIITGGHIENLLLEKVRVVEQGEGERNYHIFYQIAAAAKALRLGRNEAASMDLARALGLANDSASTTATHFYTRGDGSVEGMDDVKEYEAMATALDALGVQRGTVEERTILEVAVAVYMTGDICFEDVDGESCMLHEAARSKQALGHVAALLGVDVDKLSTSLLTRVRELRGNETVTSNNNVRQATDLRDAMAKAVYSKLFDWLVHRANAAFDRSSAKESQFIGVLDIFGFEDMASNGFEQVFINTTNEQLQKVFNDIIFTAEEEEYSREQIEWDKTVFPDNSPCIDLLTRRPAGILRILDAECLRGNAASDGAKLAAKLNKAHGSHQFFEVCGPASVWRRNSGERTHDEDFLVHHFAGPIVYTISHFIDKNRDSLYGHVHDVLSQSTVSIVKEIFPKREVAAASAEDNKPAAAASQKENTVANRYLGQLTALVEVLKESSTRFVRCIKSNHDKVPAKLDKPAALRQLICSGVMAALEVRRAGFPTRMHYREFVSEFRAFTPRGVVVNDNKALAAKMMQNSHVMERVGAANYRLGVSKIFMQAEVLYTLESIKNSMLYPFVRRLQRWWIRMQGSIIQRKYKRCCADLSDAQSEASVKAVIFVSYVADALDECEACQYETSSAVAKLAAQQTETGPLAVAALDWIAKFRELNAGAQKVVAHAVAAKEEAYKLRAEVLAQIDAASSRCEALKTVANELYDPQDSKQLLKSTREAESALSACRIEVLAAANQWDSATLHHYANHVGGSPRPLANQERKTLMRDSEEAGISPEQKATQRRDRVNAAVKLVRAAELSSLAMIEKKRQMEEARQEFQGSLDLASERLSAIQVDVFIIANIKTVSNAVAAARDSIFAAQKALQAVDPEPCKAAVEHATRSVEHALVVAQHEAARVASMVTLDESERTLTEITYQASTAELNATQLTDMMTLAEDLISTARNACQYPDIAVLRSATQRAVDAVNNCGELLERLQAKKRAEEKARFNKLLGRFQKMDEESKQVPKFAQKAGNANKPLFKVKRVNTEDNENVSGVGPRSSIVLQSASLQSNAQHIAASQQQPPQQHQHVNVASASSSSENLLGSAPATTTTRSVVNLAPEAPAAPTSAVVLTTTSVVLPPTPRGASSSSSSSMDVDQKTTPETATPAPPPARMVTRSSSNNNMGTLADWIAEKNLEKYAPQILEIACDCSDLLEITDEDADELIASCGMPKLAARRLRKSLIELGAKISP